MDPGSSPEDRLREACAHGDYQAVRDLVQQGAEINSQHSINGWTALHWAAKRSQDKVVSYLIEQGADMNVTSTKGELPWHVAGNEAVQSMLKNSSGVDTPSREDLPITANYLTNPAFPYVTDRSPQHRITNHYPVSPSSNQRSMPVVNSINGLPIDPNELVVKARIAYMDEKDFIEVELNRNQLTHANLQNLMCKELGVDPRNVFKIRKLPDTIVRKDKDVNRLVDYQELELVLHSRVMSAASRNYGPQVKTEQILY